MNNAVGTSNHNPTHTHAIKQTKKINDMLRLGEIKKNGRHLGTVTCEEPLGAYVLSAELGT